MCGTLDRTTKIMEIPQHPKQSIEITKSLYFPHTYKNSITFAFPHKYTLKYQQDELDNLLNRLSCSFSFNHKLVLLFTYSCMCSRVLVKYSSTTTSA